MYKISSVLLLFVFTIQFSINTNAQEILNGIIERGELRIGMSGDQPPYSMKANDGSLFGLDVDLATGLAERMGVKATIVKMNFKDLLPALNRGELDVVISGLTMTMERNKRAAFIGPYLISGNTIATKSEELSKITEIGELDKPNIKVAVTKGTTSEEYVTASIPNATIYKSNTNKESLKMLMEGTVDVMVADFATISVALLDNRTAGLYTTPKPLDKEAIGIAIAPSDPLFINLTTNYLNSLERRGILEMLKVKWFEEGSWILEKEVK